MAIESSTSLRTIPWRHQREAVDFVRQLFQRGKRGAMIAAAMGTGKSAMTVYLCIEDGFRTDPDPLPAARGAGLEAAV